MLAGVGARHTAAATGTALRYSRRQLSSFAANRSTAIPLRRGGYGSTAFKAGPLAAGSVRFASSAPGSAEAAPSPTGEVHFDAIPDLNSIDLSAIPEQMGYLKSMGLDYGWGPSSLVQVIVESMHIHAGLSWVGTALAFAVISRLILWKPIMVASDQTARMQHAKSILGPINTTMKECFQKGDQAGMMRAKQQSDAIRQRYGINTAKTFLPFLQAPLGLGAFRVYNGMSNLPVPSLEQESFAWIQDLTAADPYYILPVSVGALLWLTMKRTKASGLQSTPPADNPQMAQMTQAMTTTMPIVFCGFACFLPGILQIYLVGSVVMSHSQTYLMTVPKFREFFHMTPIPPPPKTEKQKTINTTKTQSSQNVSFIDRSINKVSSASPFRLVTKYIRDWRRGKRTRSAKKGDAEHDGEFDDMRAYDRRRRAQEEEERQMRNQQRKDAVTRRAKNKA